MLFLKDSDCEILLYIDGLVQERRYSIANAMELHLFCANPLISCCIRPCYQIVPYLLLSILVLIGQWKSPPSGRQPWPPDMNQWGRASSEALNNGVDNPWNITSWFLNSTPQLTLLGLVRYLQKISNCWTFTCVIILYNFNMPRLQANIIWHHGQLNNHFFFKPHLMSHLQTCILTKL